MNDVIVKRIEQAIKDFSPEAKIERVGRVIKVGDGIVEIEGLSEAKMAEMILFEDREVKSVKESLADEGGLFGVVLNLEEDTVKAILLGDIAAVREGMIAKSTGRVLSVPVGEGLIGRVTSALGDPLDGKGAIKASAHYPVEREAYGVIDRQSVNYPVETGIKAIDSMIPIGRGQRELIIGDRATGKTTVAIDTIINQRNEPEESRPVCIYVAIGQKESKTARIVAQLQEAGSMEYTIVVDAGASAPAALQFLAPYAGVAMGEYFMEKGKDVVIIYDDLSKQATAYRQLSLLLRRPPGREAYPGDIFYLHSRLLERAAKLSDEKGGGSITALPIIETQENDVSAYIPTNVISITDGQIFLEADLFNKGVRPAINVGISVSRVGSAAQTKAMKKVSGKLRLELAQFRELESFMQFAQDLDEATKKRLERGSRLAELLKQGKNVPMPFERQSAVIYAGNAGYLASVPLAKIGEFEKKLLAYLDAEHAGVLKEIRQSRDLSDATEKKLKKALDSFMATHPELSEKQGAK